MKKLSVVVLVTLAACGGSAKSAVTIPVNNHFEVVGKWSNPQGDQVFTVFTELTDRQDLRAFAAKLPGPKRNAVCVEFFNDKASTPNLSGAKKVDDALALCTAAESSPTHVATYRVDPAAGEQFTMKAQ